MEISESPSEDLQQLQRRLKMLKYVIQEKFEDDTRFEKIVDLLKEYCIDPKKFQLFLSQNGLEILKDSILSEDQRTINMVIRFIGFIGSNEYGFQVLLNTQVPQFSQILNIFFFFLKPQALQSEEALIINGCFEGLISLLHSSNPLPKLQYQWLMTNVPNLVSILFKFIPHSSRYVERSSMLLLSRVTYLSLEFNNFDALNDSLQIHLSSIFQSKEESGIQAINSFLLSLSDHFLGCNLIFQKEWFFSCLPLITETNRILRVNIIESIEHFMKRKKHFLLLPFSSEIQFDNQLQIETQVCFQLESIFSILLKSINKNEIITLFQLFGSLLFDSPSGTSWLMNLITCLLYELEAIFQNKKVDLNQYGNFKSLNAIQQFVSKNSSNIQILISSIFSALSHLFPLITNQTLRTRFGQIIMDIIRLASNERAKKQGTDFYLKFLEQDIISLIEAQRTNSNFTNPISMLFFIITNETDRSLVQSSCQSLQYILQFPTVSNYLSQTSNLLNQFQVVLDNLLKDISWEIRDSVIELIGILFSNESSSSLRPFFKDFHFIDKIVEKQNDISSYVKAASLQSLQNICSKLDGWRLVESKFNDIIFKQILTSFEDSEVFPRRAVIDLFIGWTFQDFTLSFLQSNQHQYHSQLLSTLTKASQDDDWEVKLRCVELFHRLWISSIYLFFQLQGDLFLIEMLKDHERLVRLKICQILTQFLEQQQKIYNQYKDFQEIHSKLVKFYQQIEEQNLLIIHSNSIATNLYYTEDEDFLFLADVNPTTLDCV